jgi:4-oxalocrotonate tautomerase
VPLINVKIIEGVFDGEQKQQIVRSLTEAMVTIEGENMRSVTWCIVEEVASGDWGIGGQPLTTGDVKALAAGVHAG